MECSFRRPERLKKVHRSGQSGRLHRHERVRICQAIAGWRHSTQLWMLISSLTALSNVTSYEVRLYLHLQTKDDFFRLNSEMLNTQAGSKQVNKNARVYEGMMIAFGLIHLLEVSLYSSFVRTTIASEYLKCDCFCMFLLFRRKHCVPEPVIL